MFHFWWTNYKVAASIQSDSLNDDEWVVNVKNQEKMLIEETSECR